ncbi:MAG: response regulator [Endomicrobiaceae bacterium]|nr:response regulator [Endomicrobiaceae bacterium]
MDKKLKILVVDDEDALRFSLASILEMEGFEVKTAEDGFKAVELAEKESFDILFSDIRMPGRTGTETFKLIKKIRPDIIGVMMTAYALNDLIVEALNLGAFTCLSKPFEIGTVLSTIKDVTSRPFAVVVDDEANLNSNFLSSLKHSGLNVATTAMDMNKIDFMFKHKPDILILRIDNDITISLSILEKLKEMTGSIPKTILVGSQENDAILDKFKKIGTVAFIKTPICIPQVFEILGKENRKYNIAMINAESDEFITLRASLLEKKFNLIPYVNFQNFFDEIKYCFFDTVLINAKIETNISDFHDKLHSLMPNIGAIYILQDDANVEALKKKGCFYLTKPFEIEDIISLINKIRK